MNSSRFLPNTRSGHRDSSTDASFQSQMERISALQEELRPGRHPVSVAHGRETNLNVPLPTTIVVSEQILTFDSNKIEHLSPNFSIHKFIKWKMKWSDHCPMSGIARFSPRSQIACLRAVRAPDMSDTSQSLGVTTETTLSVDEILDRLQGHLGLQRNILVDRYAFLD